MNLKKETAMGIKASSMIMEPDVTTTMKAVRIHGYGGPEMLKYEDAPRPRPRAGEVLVRVHASGVNPVDWKIRQGYAKDRLHHTLPLVLGWDFSGIVEETGPDVTRLKKGDPVYSRPDIARNGAYAQYIVARESEVALKPGTIDHIHAAAIPLAALTAWQSLFDMAGLTAGQTVLIHAAAGGVGSFAVQLAKWKGARVIGTASADNHDFLRALGADEVIDYNTTPFEEVVRKVDVVFDTIGSDVQRRSWQVLRKGGILVSIVTPPLPEEAAAHGVRPGFVFVQPNAAQLAEIAALVDAGKLRPIVETILPLSEARRAQELSQMGHTRGKIVLEVT
jgi:NADPH:quinone reductase-like Zn-dependent oxidoreductase